VLDFRLDEQERVQKKTFTKWMNIYLSLHEPPYHIHDLFEDLKDGTKLIALLEVLSGQTLVSATQSSS
jgi:nesprin-1